VREGSIAALELIQNHDGLFRIANISMWSSSCDAGFQIIRLFQI
jgi:hypothetical protein